MSDPRPAGRIRICDLVITATLWIFYTLGFVVRFLPICLGVSLFCPARREETFQRVNHRHHRLFFALLGRLAPRIRWRVSEEVRNLRSGMILANHLSFLDPILLVSLYEKQKTIVKSDYFRIPVFGWLLRGSGYIPSVAEGFFASDMTDPIKGMREYLEAGGKFFIFPEGTRSRSGRIGPFESGAFKIARLCRAAPIHVIRIRNTQRLFPPDEFLFHTRGEAVIEVELAGTIEPDYEGGSFSLSGLMDEARELMEGRGGS